MSKQFFCSSDIHSFYTEWMLSLKSSGFDINNPEHIILICGDLFDRGNESQKCFNFVKTLANQNRLVYIRGNHEDLLHHCVRDLTRARSLSHHHITNGTIRTISNLLGCSEYDVLCCCYDTKLFEEITSDVLSFIDTHSKDYFELGDKVFVHGWIPTTVVSENDHTTCVSEEWRDGDWNSARWENGIEMAHFGLIIPEKTVVCGHWHTSWGHSRYHNDGDEWDGATANFNPYYDQGIIALDACTAYTHMINVVVFDEEGNKIG